MSKPTGYSRLQISLHWIVAVLVVLQFVLHDPIVAAWEMFVKTGSSDFEPLIAAHVFGGLSILALVIWRLVVRFKRGVPALPAEESAAMKGLAHFVHWGLYALMILMPVSGAAAWFGGIELAAENHVLMKFALLALVAMHVAGALFHQFVLKTNLIDRMRTPRD